MRGRIQKSILPPTCLICLPPALPRPKLWSSYLHEENEKYEVSNLFLYLYSLYQLFNHSFLKAPTLWFQIMMMMMIRRGEFRHIAMKMRGLTLNSRFESIVFAQGRNMS